MRIILGQKNYPQNKMKKWDRLESRYFLNFLPHNKKKFNNEVKRKNPTTFYNMKRKRSPSPASQRPTSRSPLSPRSTRASTTSPAAPQLNGVRGKSADTSNNDEDNNVNGFNIRRSSRARRLSYPIFNSNFMTQDDVIRNRGLIKEAEQR